MTLAEYIELITSQHQDQPRYIATVTAGVDPFVGLQEVLRGMPADFDIDEAVGVQLDALGIWIGVSRRLSTPLVGVYFSWDDTPETGWESGSWQGEFDPDSGLVDLPDSDYRTLLKAKIAANSWDGTIPGAYEVWETVFDEGQFITITDNQNMTMIIGISGDPLSTIEQAMLVNGLLPLKPSGVRITEYLIVPEPGPLFAWDIPANDAFDGWDAGQWGKSLEPA